MKDSKDSKESGVPKRRNGIKHAFAESDPDMIIVSVAELAGVLYIASRKGIYKLEDDKLVRLEIIQKENES